MSDSSLGRNTIIAFDKWIRGYQGSFMDWYNRGLIAPFTCRNYRRYYGERKS